MFRKLNLSVTWGPINNSSYDISLFLFNLYLQQYIIDVLDFPSLCCIQSIAQPNDTIKKK